MPRSARDRVALRALGRSAAAMMRASPGDAGCRWRGLRDAVAGEFRRAASGQGVRFALDSSWAEIARLPAIRPQQYELLAIDPVSTK
jgi:hypothetical protein